MRPARCLLAVLLGLLGLAPVAAQPATAMAIALTLNEGTADVAYRGWPLILLADAVLMEDAATPIPLAPATLTLRVTAGQGAEAGWPWRRVTEFAPPPQLGPDNEGVRVTWVLTAEQSATLAPGEYQARVSWAGRTSPALTFRIEPPPASVPVEGEIVRSLRQSRVLQLTGDLAGAQAVLTPWVDKRPDRIDLLEQQSRVQLARGEHREAFQSAQRALANFHHQQPNARHPPGGLIEAATAARTALFKDYKPGPQPTIPPPGAPRTVSTPPAPGAAAPRGAASTPPVSSTSSTSSAAPARPPAAPASSAAPAVPVGGGARVGAPSAGVLATAAELADDRIQADAAGQWAAEARAGSSYSNPGFGPGQATGAPNVALAGSSAEAWCPGVQNSGRDWLEVTFARPVPAAGVRVRQTNTPGTIVKVEAFEPDGTSHLWWEGKDPAEPKPRQIAWFAVQVPPTPYPVARVKVTLDLAALTGWKQIDAVQLVAAP